MRVLIETQPNDMHADAVCWALEKHGIDVVVHIGAEFPSQTWISARVGMTESPALRASIYTDEQVLVAEGDVPDVVWNRRPGGPEVGGDLHPADVPYARRESTALLAGAREAVQAKARVLHPRTTRIIANDKLLQLDAARRAGFHIPLTLATNDPRCVREFWRECREQVIFKPFSPAQWGLGAGSAHLVTTRLTARHFDDDSINGIRQGPGIFQQEVPKQSELRVTVIGNRCYALRIFSQEHSLTQIDWRCDAALSRTRSEAVHLTAGAEARCLEVCARLGLQFGCVDLVERPGGEIVFLEVNEMGQFLWVEESARQLELLRGFVAYLADEPPECMRSDASFAHFMKAGAPSYTSSTIQVAMPFWTLETSA